MDLGGPFKYLAQRKDWRPVKDGKIVKSKPFNFTEESFDFCDWPNPRLVAELAVGMVEERTEYYKVRGGGDGELDRQRALVDFCVSRKDYEAVKKRLGEK